MLDLGEALEDFISGIDAHKVVILLFVINILSFCISIFEPKYFLSPEFSG